MNMKMPRALVAAAVALLVSGYGRAALTPARPDALTPVGLADVRLGGFVAAKLEDVIRERMKGDFARREIVGEARRAYEERSDDRPGGYGYWRGEFWGKLMLGAARAAVYDRDAEFKAWLREEGLRLAALQDADGYLGSYADPEFVSMAGKTRVDWCEMGWPSNWNLWCRKYAMWGMLRLYETTGERRLLESAARQMDHWIAQMHRRKLSLLDTGNPAINGLASMSVLKPLMLLYRETGKAGYLDYAKEIVADWDRDDGRPPNLIRNAFSGKPVCEWYPKPRAWAKAYEMMSGMDGLLDYVRLTGDARVFAAMRKLVDSLCRDEVNVFGGVGYNAMFVGAARQLNAMSEVCDTVHWIKLCQTLFLMTGESRYADLMEKAFYNELLAGAYRGGKWAAAAVRDKVRNMTHECQVGMRYNHCCVDNLPRAFFDFAETALTRDADGAVQLNFFSDLTASLGGVKVTVTGGYPVKDTVRIAVENPKGVPLKFRKPGWCSAWTVSGEGTDEVTIRFSMPPRIVRRDLPAVKDFRHDMTDPALMRYVVPWKIEGNEDVIDRLRKSPAATLERGPLLLAKSVRVGDSREQVLDARTVNDGGWSVSLEPLANADTVGAWRAVFTRGAESFAVDVCDYASAADTWYGYYADAFSIWF